MKTHLSNNKKHDVVVVCPVMKNNKNVSMIVRAASCFGASKIILTGQNRVNTHISRECDIEIEYRNSLLPVISTYRQQGFRVIAIEQSEKSKSIHNFEFPLSPVLLTMGNECRGMDQEVLNQADEVVEIPLHGKPYSLNVAMSVTICLNELARQKG